MATPSPTQNHHYALPAGTMIEHFRIERCLGRGGFAFTYLAHDTLLGCDVAIKELFPDKYVTRQGGLGPEVARLVDRRTWEDIFQRFSAEARHLAQFRHRNIVQVKDLIKANGTAYIVMQYVEGRTLNRHLDDLRRRPAEVELADIFGQVLDGLEAVHGRGLLHRDVKPDNIYLTKNGTVVLLDFGTARPEKKPPNDQSLVFLSRGYTSYEQVLNLKLKHTADIYSVAATFVRAITGKEPPEAVRRKEQDTYKLLSIQYRGRYSSSLLRGIDMGMALDAEHRPQSIAQWRGILFGKTPPPKPPRPPKPLERISQATLVFALFVCFVVAVTAVWVAVRVSSHKPTSVQAGSGKSAATLPEPGVLIASLPDMPGPSSPAPGSSPSPSPAPVSPPSAKPPPLVVAAPAVPASPAMPPAPPTSTVPRNTVISASAGPEQDDMDHALNAFLKNEIEQPPDRKNYADHISVNDGGEAGDVNEMTRDELMAEETRDVQRYETTAGQFTHLGSKRLSYDVAADTAQMSQIFCYDRTLRRTGTRHLGLAIRQVTIMKASTQGRCISRRVVTARASGYRCRLSAEDHPAPPGGGTASFASPSQAERILSILQQDRNNYQSGSHRDSEDLDFQLFKSEEERRKITTVEENQLILIPGGDASARQIITENPVVDVFPDLEGTSPAIVIVIKH